jgi:hypothetical protein
MLNALRSVVSKSNRRFVNDNAGYNFDLTYIDDRTVAMGWPATGLEGAYRNPADRVNEFLHQEANDRGIHFKIYNLTDRQYPQAQFNDIPVEQFGFPDHHPPSLELLLQILKSMCEWLAADPSNSVVAHCLAGHGRTGTVISAMHLFEGMFDNPEESLENFAQKRSTAGKGVAYPSQKRAVHAAYRHLLRCRELGRDRFELWPAEKRVILKVEITLIWIAPKARRLTLLVQDGAYQTIWNSAWITGRPTMFVPQDGGVVWLPEVMVQGTFTVRLTDGKDILRTTLYTDFLDLAPTEGGVTLPKAELDGPHRDQENREYDPRLTLTLDFSSPQ